MAVATEGVVETGGAPFVARDARGTRSRHAEWGYCDPQSPSRRAYRRVGRHSRVGDLPDLAGAFRARLSDAQSGAGIGQEAGVYRLVGRRSFLCVVRIADHGCAAAHSRASQCREALLSTALLADHAAVFRIAGFCVRHPAEFRAAGRGSRLRRHANFSRLVLGLERQCRGIAAWLSSDAKPDRGDGPLLRAGGGAAFLHTVALAGVEGQRTVIAVDCRRDDYLVAGGCASRACAF